MAEVKTSRSVLKPTISLVTESILPVASRRYSSFHIHPYFMLSSRKAFSRSGSCEDSTTAGRSGKGGP